jgi:HK97 family phage major capsid protein
MTAAVEQVTEALAEMGRRADEWRQTKGAEIDELKASLKEVEKKANRPRLGGSGQDKEETPEQAEYRKAFNAYLRRGTDAGLADLGHKAMNSGSDPDGGFLVLPEMDRTIDRIAQTVSPMYRIANVVPVGSQKWEKLVKTSGMAMRRVANGSTGGETTEPKLAKVEIEVFPAEVEPWVHNETLEDAVVNLEADLADEAGISFSEGGGAEFITGNGVGCARGILAYPIVANSAYAWGSLGYVVTGLSAGFAAASTSVNSADSLVTLQHALKAKYKAGATWLMNSATAGVVRKLKDADGRHVWSDSLINGQPALLLGSPVEIDDNMPDVSAASYSIAYGDFKRGYTIANRRGTTLIRDPYTSKGITKFNFRRRFGAGVTHYEAIKLLKFATS